MTSITNNTLVGQNYRSNPRRKCWGGQNGYLLIEVLVAMTIFAIAGSVLLRSLISSIEAAKTLRDTTKAIYLTKYMLHTLELNYTRKDNVELGEFDGNFPQPGTDKFRWHAIIEYNKDRDAYIISVRTTWEDDEQYGRRRRGRWRRNDNSGFMLKTMVLTARYNKELLSSGGMGGQPQIQKRGNARNQGGGKRR